MGTRALIDEVTPPEAWDILVNNPQAILLDVRSRAEFEYVGHPPGAINIPWKDAPDWQVDSGFVEKVRALLATRYPDTECREELTVLMLCRSGARSRSAGVALQEQGFARVYNVAEGFEGDRDKHNHRNTINGWRVHGLPWEQS